MSSPKNDFSFAKEFVGNLRSKTGRVPVRVHTKLRTITEETAREIRTYSIPDSAPLYMIGGGPELPVHPSLQAMGRHYFTW